MSWLFVIVAIAVLAGVFLAVLGLLGELPPVEPDMRPDLRDGDPAFDVVVRGYRMDEVDERIEALQGEIERLSGMPRDPEPHAGEARASVVEAPRDARS